MGIHRDPVLVVETPSSPYGHRYIVLPDRIIGDADAAQLCSRLNREGMSEGSDWIGLSRLGMQKAFGGGRTGYQRVVLSGTNVAALTPELRQSIEQNLMSVLERMDELIQLVDWKDGETNLVVTSPLLSQFLTFEWKDLPPSARVASKQGSKLVLPPRLIPALGGLAVLLLGFFVLKGFFFGSGNPPQPSQPDTPPNAPPTVVASAEKTITRPPEKPVAAPEGDRTRWEDVDRQLQENVPEATLDQTLLNLADEDKNEGWNASRLQKLANYYLALVDADLKAPAKEKDKADTRAKLVLTKRLNRWKTFGPIGKFHEQPEFARNFFPIALKKIDDYVYQNLLDQIFGKVEMVRLLVDDGSDTSAIANACYDYLAFQQDRGLNDFPKHLELIPEKDRDRFEKRREAIDRMKGWPSKFERPNASKINLEYGLQGGTKRNLFDRWTLLSGDLHAVDGKRSIMIEPGLSGKTNGNRDFNVLPLMLILKRQPKAGEASVEMRKEGGEEDPVEEPQAKKAQSLVKVGMIKLRFQVSVSENPKLDGGDGDALVDFEFPLQIVPNLIVSKADEPAKDPWFWGDKSNWIESNLPTLLKQPEGFDFELERFRLIFKPNLETPLIFPD